MSNLIDINSILEIKSDDVRDISRKVYSQIEKNPSDSLNIIFENYGKLYDAGISFVNFLQHLKSVSNSQIFRVFIFEGLIKGNLDSMEFKMIEAFEGETPAIHMLFSWIEHVLKLVNDSVKFKDGLLEYIDEGLYSTKANT